MDLDTAHIVCKTLAFVGVAFWGVSVIFFRDAAMTSSGGFGGALSHGFGCLCVIIGAVFAAPIVVFWVCRGLYLLVT